MNNWMKILLRIKEAVVHHRTSPIASPGVNIGSVLSLG
jgi:hypothetical protein